MTVAGANEAKFIRLFESKVGKGVLKGKCSYQQSNVSISVDNSLIHNNRLILIEIDSGNMAKLLVGQYTLLNHLYTGIPDNAHFLVVHTYKNYNVERTLNNLALVAGRNKFRIPFSAMHITDLEAWVGGSLDEFLSMPST